MMRGIGIFILFFTCECSVSCPGYVVYILRISDCLSYVVYGRKPRESQ